MAAVKIDVRSACGCCELGSAEVEASLAVRARVAVGWANASAVNSLGLLIADEKGYNLANFDGYYRVITITEGFPIIEPGTGRVGTWTRETEVTHTGDAVVPTVGDKVVNTSVEEDAEPADPQYVDPVIDYDASDVVVSGEITDAVYRSYLVGAIVSVDFEAIGETPVPELEEWFHGIAIGDGYAVAREAQFLPTVVFKGYDPETQVIATDVADGAISLPAHVKTYDFNVVTEAEGLASASSPSLPWVASYGSFAEEDPAPDPTTSAVGWETFPSLSTSLWYRAEQDPTWGDLWPSFRLV